MAAPEVAVAYISIVPSMRGFPAQLRRQVAAPMASEGRRAGGSLGSSMAAGASAGMARMASSATATAQGIGESFRGMAATASAAMATIGAASVARDITTLAAESQRTEAVLDGLYRTAGHGAGEAAQMMDLMWDTFRGSSLGMAAFQEAATSLAYMGLSAEETTELMVFLDQAISATGGGEVELNNVSEALLNMQNQGKASLDQINRLSSAGVPAIDLLADHFSTGNAELMAMVSNGEVLVDDVLAAIQAQGGTYATGLIEGAQLADQTFVGAWDSIRANFVHGISRELVPLFESLTPMMMGFASSVDGAFDRLPGAISAAGAALREFGVVDAFDRLFAGLREVAAGIGPLFTAAMQGVGLAFAGVALAAGPVGDMLGHVGRMMQEYEPVVRQFGMAVGILTGAFLAFRAAMSVVGLIGAMLNPVTLVIGAVALLGVGLYQLWEHSQGFRSAVEPLVEALGDLASTMADWLSGAVSDLADLFQERIMPPLVELGSVIMDDVLPALGSLAESVTDAILPVFGWVADLLIETVIPALMTVWESLLSYLIPVFQALSGFITDHVVPGVQELSSRFLEFLDRARPVIDVVVEIGTWLFDLATTILSWVVPAIINLAGPIFTALVDAVLFAIDVLFAISDAFMWVVDVVITVGGWFTWLWENAVEPSISAAGSLIDWLWDTVIQPVFGWIDDRLQETGAVFTWLWENAVSPAMSGIRSVVDTVWNSGVKPIFDAMKTGVDAIATAFETAKDAIEIAWDKLQEIAAKPVRFIVNTVYNKGIVRVWNAVAGAFGASTLDEVNIGFSRGGILPGTSSWRDGDDQLVPMRRGEGVYVSEAMKDPYERARLAAVNSAARRGDSLAQFQGGGYARGGVVGWAKNAVSKGLGAGSAVWDGIRAGAEWVSETLGGSVRAGVERIVNPLIDRIPGLQGMYGDMVKRVPTAMVDALFGHADESDKAFEAEAAKSAWLRPAGGAISARYGQSGAMWSSGYHTGTDFAAPGGSPVRAVAPGIVGMTSSAGPYGNHIRLNHAGGLQSLYAHLSSMAVGMGDMVTRGSLIGLVGSTGNSSGPHLHLEAMRGGRRINPESLFDSGGWLMPGTTTARNATGRPEPVLTSRQWEDIHTLAGRGGSGLQPGDRLVLSTGSGQEFEAYVDSRASGVVRRDIARPAKRGRR